MKIEVNCCEGMDTYRNQCLTDRCPEYVEVAQRRGSRLLQGAPTPSHGSILGEVRREISDAIEAVQPEGIVDNGGRLIARLSGAPQVYETAVGNISARYEETEQNGRALKWVILEGEAMKPKRRRRRRGRLTADGIRRIDITAGIGSQQISTNKHITVLMKEWPKGAK